MDLKEQEILGDRAGEHWYYRAKSAAMLRALGGAPIGQILDVGAGSGFFSRHLLDHTQATDAICVDPNYAAESREDHHGKPIAFVHDVERFDGNLVLMMDVLEHVADDTALLSGYAARMQPGTRLLITVPAHRWLWSGHDVFLEHYRRYTVGEVDRLVARAGLELLTSFYFFGLTLPLAAAVRLGRKLNPARNLQPGSDMRAHSRLVNGALLAISHAEMAIPGRNRLAGLSVFALAQAAPSRPKPPSA